MALSTITRTPDQLDAILRSGAGSLVETPYPILLIALAYRGKSAELTLQRNPLQKEIVFDSGAPIDCQSNIATETFGRFLVSSGKLSELDCHTALNLASNRGVSFEDVLIEQKLIPPADLARMAQQSLGRKLLEPFSWKIGTFEISYDVAPVESELRVKIPQLVLTGILKVETQESVDEAMTFARDRYLALPSQPLFDLDDVRLTSEQQKIVEAAREGMPFDALATETGIDADDAHRVVYALLLLGALTMTDSPKREVPMFELENPFRKSTMEAPLPEPVPPPLPPPVQTPPPVHLPPVEVEPPQKVEPARPGVPPATAEEVVAAFLSHKQKDAFDLLGVADTDGPLQFMRAFLAMSDRFLPSKFDERAPNGLRDKAQEVFLAAARAYAELVDPARRATLLASRTRKIEPRPDLEATLIVPSPAAPEKPVEKPVTKAAERKPMKAAIIDPELLCKSGRELADAGKLREALSSFEMAAECDAQNGTYAAEVAWCRFRLQVSPAPTTLKMLKNAIRIDPRSGLANLYAGKVAAALGNRNEAGEFFNRAAMLMPRDMRVVEALKALR